MTTSLIPSNVQIPAHLANRVGAPSALAASIGGGISGGESIPRISIKGARFRIIDGDTETVLDSTTLDTVIVGANPRLSKTFYAKQWTPDAEPQAPDCFSMDGVRPDASAIDPQNDLCASCPQNAWGSKVTPLGQQIKACSDTKRLAVVAADDPEGAVYLLVVTPAALKNLNQYQKELAIRGIPPEIVRTRISFDTDASFPKLKFGFGGFLDEATQAAVDRLFGSDAVKAVTGEASPAAPAEPAAPAKPVLVKPKPASQPAEGVAEAPMRGFRATKPKAEAPKAEVPKAEAPKAEAPKAAPKTASWDAQRLADEIAEFVMTEGADDD